MDYMKNVFYVFMCYKCGCSDDCEEDTLETAIKTFRERGWMLGKERNTCPR